MYSGCILQLKTVILFDLFRVPLPLLELEAIEVGVGSGSRPARSNPVNMPVSSGSRPVVPVLIESGSGSM
jgi:hypothetical protein